MLKKVFRGFFLFKIALVLTKEAELPLCPTNVLYFPQNLPMHCRMPTNADFPGMSGSLPGISGSFSAIPQIQQNPSSDKQRPLPMPIPFPSGMPGAVPFPGPVPMPGPMPIPGPIGPPGPMPFPGPMPHPPGPGQKLPVIVMPFYSPDNSFKKGGRPNYLQHSLKMRKKKVRHRRKRPHIYSPDTSSNTDSEASSDSSSSSSSEYQGWWKGKRNHRRFDGPNRMKKKKHYQKKQLLTPVLQYVTKDGYVIFEKKISKNEAKDWLNVKKGDNAEISTRISPEVRDMESNEPTDDHIVHEEMVTDDKVEMVTKRTHRLNRLKAHRDKAVRLKHNERQH